MIAHALQPGARVDRREAGARGAFTLVEVLLATAIIGVLMAALASTVAMAARAVPKSDDPTVRRVNARRLLERISSELSTALSVSVTGPSDLTMLVADVTRDGTPDTLRYSWGGLDDEPLWRSLNGSTPEPTLASVSGLSVTLTTDQSTTTTTSAPVESAERLLASYTLAAPDELKVHAARWCAQFVQPRLSSRATGWRPTRVRILLRSSGTRVGQAVLELRAASSTDRPATGVLSFATINEATLPVAMGWQTFTLAGAPTLAPSAGVVLVVRHVTDSISCEIAANWSSVMDSLSALSESSDSGATWTLNPEGSMVYELYGTVTEPVTTTATVARARTADLTLAIGKNGAPNRVVESRRVALLAALEVKP